jgi:hypothetical protein
MDLMGSKLAVKVPAARRKLSQTVIPSAARNLVSRVAKFLAALGMTVLRFINSMR